MNKTKIFNSLKPFLNEAPNLAKSMKAKMGDVTYSKDGDTKYTVDDIDWNTGRVGWKTEKLHNFEELFDSVDALVKTARGVYTKKKEDKLFREVYESAKELKNQIRTHLRNEYPDEYKRMVSRIDENSLDDKLKNALGDRDFEKVINTPVPSISDMVGLNDKRIESVVKAITDKYDIKDDSMLRGTIRLALADYLSEDDVDEISTSGAAGAYLTPYAFRRKGAKPNDKAYKEIGYKEVNEEGASWGLEPRQLADSFTFEELEQLYNDNKITKEDLTGAKGYLQAWIDQHPTYLPQRDLTKPFRQKIRDKYLNEESNIDMDRVFMKGKDKEKFYVTINRGHGDGKFLVKSSESEYKEPRVFSRDEAEAYVERAKKSGGIPGRIYAYWVSDINMDRIYENTDPGASLGPGPKAGKKGVDNSAYTSEFGYKLVPEKIKGSGLEVKHLFDESKGPKDFQKKRIFAFDAIEHQINDIYKMLSNAKNETSEYYNDNPSSYTVVKPTDLVLDYIKDIKDLLKGE